MGQEERDSEDGHEEDPQPNDPCPSLLVTRSRIQALHQTISNTRLFDLCWKEGDFVEHSFIADAEEEIHNANAVAEEGEMYTNYLIETSTSVTKAAEELTNIVKEKLATEFEDYKPGKKEDEEFLKKLHKNTVAFNKFDAFRRRIEEVAKNVMKVTQDAAVARASLKATKMLKTFWDQNKDNMKLAEDLYKKRIEEKEEAKRREEEERRRQEEEERRRQQEEREKAESERREREEREREEREKTKLAEEKRRREEEEKKRLKEEKRRKKEEDERRKRELEEKKRREEEAERARRDPKNWKSLLYNAKEKTKRNKGLCCVFRAFTNSLTMSDLKVTEVPPAKNLVPIEPGEELASTIVDVKSENGQLSFPFPAVLSMPNFGGSHNFFTMAAKLRVDDADEWQTVPAKDTRIEQYKDLAECELPAFTTLRIAFLRTLQKDTQVIKPKGCSIVSSAEPKISITFPRDCLANPRNISLVVRHVDHRNLETLKRHSKGCANVRSASHMLCIENLDSLVRFKEKIKLTMPAVEHLKKKEDKTDKSPPVHTMAVQLGADGHWSVCTNADTEPNEEGIVAVQRGNPLSRLVVLGMATPSEAEAEFAACRLNQHLDEHVIKFVQRQSETDRRLVVTDCVHTEEARNRILEWTGLDFTAGPVTPSKEILAKEGQEFTMALSKRGNIRRIGFSENPTEGAITFVYHSNLRCSSSEFSVEPLDIYGQHGRDFYFGHNEFFTVDKTGKTEKVHEFEVMLPRPVRAKPAVQRAPVFFSEGVISEAVFKRISTRLFEDEWLQLASRLQLKKAKLQRIEREHGGLEDIVFAALWDWYKTTTISGNKVEILCRALRKIDKEGLANYIEEQEEGMNQRRRMAAQENELSKAFLSVQESSVVLREWQNLGRHLGVADDEITALDIDEGSVKEKCYQVLNTWKENAGEKATLEQLIKVLRRMNINNVADYLERRQSNRPKTAVTSSRPKTGAAGKQSARPATRR